MHLNHEREELSCLDQGIISHETEREANHFSGGPIEFIRAWRGGMYIWRTTGNDAADTSGRCHICAGDDCAAGNSNFRRRQAHQRSEQITANGCHSE
jgi:hypothetical protein